tara:strand:+ start:923 stop:1147 length:225 start_codon:yes stop_codon:yes gene_type:complete
MWIIYVLLMSADRSLEGFILDQRFNNETECNSFYNEHKIDINNDVNTLINENFSSHKLITIGCLTNFTIERNKQ